MGNNFKPYGNDQNSGRDYRDKNRGDRGRRDGYRAEKPKPEDLFETWKSRMVTKPLMAEYGNQPDIFLEGQYLYQTAKSIYELKVHQVRKVLAVTKEALTIARSSSDFSKAKKRLFILLPMLAYNTGRAKKEEQKNYENLLRFVYTNVNQDSITTIDDIEMFDQMIISVIAYHKFLGGKE